MNRRQFNSCCGIIPYYITNPFKNTDQQVLKQQLYDWAKYDVDNRKPGQRLIGNMVHKYVNTKLGIDQLNFTETQYYIPYHKGEVKINSVPKLYDLYSYLPIRLSGPHLINEESKIKEYIIYNLENYDICTLISFLAKPIKLIQHNKHNTIINLPSFRLSLRKDGLYFLKQYDRLIQTESISYIYKRLGFTALDRESVWYTKV